MTIKQTILAEATRRKDNCLTRKAIRKIWSKYTTETKSRPGGSFWRNLEVVSRSKTAPAAMRRVDDKHYVRVNGVTVDDMLL